MDEFDETNQLALVPWKPDPQTATSTPILQLPDTPSAVPSPGSVPCTPPPLSRQSSCHSVGKKTTGVPLPAPASLRAGLGSLGRGGKTCEVDQCDRPAVLMAGGCMPQLELLTLHICSLQHVTCPCDVSCSRCRCSLARLTLLRVIHTASRKALFTQAKAAGGCLRDDDEDDPESTLADMERRNHEKFMHHLNVFCVEKPACVHGCQLS